MLDVDQQRFQIALQALAAALQEFFFVGGRLGVQVGKAEGFADADEHIASKALLRCVRDTHGNPGQSELEVRCPFGGISEAHRSLADHVQPPRVRRDALAEDGNDASSEQARHASGDSQLVALAGEIALVLMVDASGHSDYPKAAHEPAVERVIRNRILGDQVDLSVGELSGATGIGRFTYGTLDYQGNIRRDQTYSVSGDLIYKMNRTLWVKGTLRRDWLDSNIPGNSTASTVALVGVRVQN